MKNKMAFECDQDVQAVLEFMQSNIEASKLEAVADCLPQLARLLWGHNPQEPIRAISLEVIYQSN